MPIERSENWFLKKHDSGEVFGPVPFDKIREWAHSAQVNALDMLSTDQIIWTKAPMIPETEMDWLIVVGENLLYGPTTAEALLEFERLGEINAATALINCTTGVRYSLGETAFYRVLQAEDLNFGEARSSSIQPGRGTGLRVSLQQRIRELENALLEKGRKLTEAEETIARLEARILKLEDRIRDYSGFRRR
ncbi:MAG TPA: hypothetical protein VFS35_01865 [Terrimicrobiaceae bacterium]|nr:hypothetical protein [Terrimicrobiaceae bacterium]